MNLRSRINDWIQPSRLHPNLLLWLMVFGIVFVVVITAAQSLGDDPSEIPLSIVATIGVILTVVILQHPFWGFVITIGAIPIFQLLPRFLENYSPLTFLGGITFGAYLFRYFTSSDPDILASRKRFELIIAGTGALVIWVFAIRPTDISLGSPVMTFAQLLILVFLSKHLVKNPLQVEVLMIAFGASAAISAILAANDVAVLRTTLAWEARSDGLVGSENEAARVFAVGLVFLYYLLRTRRMVLTQIVIGIGMSFLILGLISTGSRTGTLIAIIAGTFIFLNELFFLRRRAQRQIDLSGVYTLALFGIVLIVVFGFLNPSRISASLEGRFALSLEENIRWEVWNVGVRMWQDYPIQGVGIGQFVEYSQDYYVGRVYQLNLHNTYMNYLVETGLIGFGLFVFIVAVAVFYYVRTIRQANEQLGRLTATWFIAFVLLLIGGLTKQDDASKIQWLCIGMSIALKNIHNEATAQDETAPQPDAPIAFGVPENRRTAQGALRVLPATGRSANLSMADGTSLRRPPAPEK
ncbi:MAG: O-antigen ligase family protein [Anaerolinea sp.]|nr:O-antigen ligase family protein [Anaerolinea sp.]CAG0971968.1 hypothetical protein ANRL4_01320 [Anaerolineae bacterium]